MNFSDRDISNLSFGDGSSVQLSSDLSFAILYTF